MGEGRGEGDFLFAFFTPRSFPNSASLQYCPQHCVQIIQHVVVDYAQHAIPRRLELRLAFAVVDGTPVMAIPIEFDDQAVL
jgi:hypothetical protein